CASFEARRFGSGRWRGRFSRYVSRQASCLLLFFESSRYPARRDLHGRTRLRLQLRHGMEHGGTRDRWRIYRLVFDPVQKPALFARAGANLGNRSISNGFAKKRIRLLALRDAASTGPCAAVRTGQWSGTRLARPQYPTYSLWPAGRESFSE